MDEIRFVLLVFVIYFSITTNVISQISFFDSVNIVSSSDIYDYKNPVFDIDGWMVYERHSGGVSNIVIRKSTFNGFDPEILITNSHKALNINPSISRNILVWQSNEGGDWDLYYSVFNGYWSQPMLLDSSDTDETNPCIQNNNTYPVQYNFHYLVYNQDNNIRMKIRSTLSQNWYLDTSVTSDTNNYSTPILTRGPNGNQYTIVYLKNITGDFSRINSRIFSEPQSKGSIFFQLPYEIIQANTQQHLTLANGWITYSYDTLSSKHLLGFSAGGGQNFREIFTKNIPGRHYEGKASHNSLITDNPFYVFSVFCSLTKNNDSTQLILINRLNSFSNDPSYKKVHIGDTSVFIKFDLSQPQYQGSLFKIRAVWENKFNGKTALFHSNMMDAWAEISGQNMQSEKFNLSQNYPNPFNPVTNLEFGILKSEFVSLKVYDILGNEVATLVNEKKSPGIHNISFDGSNLSSGIYFYRIAVHSDKLETETFSDTKSMILLK